MASPERAVPHNIEAEESLLGSLLIDPEALFRVATFLHPDDFYIRKNGWIYEAILALHERLDEVAAARVVPYKPRSDVAVDHKGLVEAGRDAAEQPAARNHCQRAAGAAYPTS